MILIDANLLLFAYDTTSAFHKPAKAWLEEVLSGHSPVGFSWSTLLAFLRISTNPRAFKRPLTSTAAIEIVSDWVGQPVVDIIGPGERYWELLARLIQQGQASGPIIMDAALAALSVEHGAVLYTHDRDFEKFPGVEVRYPLLS